MTDFVKNTDDAKNKSGDLNVFGNPDVWKLLCKASSESTGFMKSTKVLEVEGVGCFVQVTTQYKNPDGSYGIAEAVAWAPGIKVIDKAAHEDGLSDRELVSNES